MPIRKAHWFVTIGVLVVGGAVALAGNSLATGDTMGSDTEFDRIVAAYAPEPVPAIPEGENWAPLVRQFQDDGTPLRWPEHEWKNREARLAECEKAGFPALVDEIAKRPYYYEEKPNAMLPVRSSRLRDLSDFLALRARSRGASGDVPGSLQDVATLRHMALSYAMAGSGPMQCEASSDLAKANFVTIELLTRGRLNRRQIQDVIDQPAPDFGAMMKQALRRDIQGEFLSTIRAGRFNGESTTAQPWVLLQRPTDETFDFVYGRYDRIETAKLLGTLVAAYDKDVDEGNGLDLANYRSAQAGLGNAQGTVDFRPGVAQRIDACRRTIQVHQQDNARGRGLLQLVPVTIAFGQSQSGFDLTRLAAALELFRLNHGTLPADLQDLVQAGILESVPLDRACGKPFCYDPERRLLWSRGSNGALDPEDEVADGLSADFNRTKG